MTAPAPDVDLGGRSPWSILPPLCLGFFMIMVDTTIVNIAVPTLQAAFDASLVTVGWVNSAYLLTFAVLLLVTGRMGDRFGPRPVFVAGLVVFTVASLACGLAGSVGVLIAARAVQGIGGALMTPQTMAMITRVFPAQKRGAALGIWGSVAGVATITGPVLGGVLVESVGWEWIFYVNIPVGGVALWLALTRLPALPTHARTFDVPGVVLSVVGMSLLVFGLQEGAAYDWGTIVGPITVPLVIGAGAVVSGVFLIWQRHRGEDALLPLRLFVHRNFALANLAGAAVSFAMTGIFFPFTLYLQQVLGLSPLHAALVGLPGSLISGVVAPFAGRLSDRVAGKWVVFTGFVVLAVSIGVLATQVQPDVAVWRLVVPMLGFGVGTGLVFSPLGNLATTGLDQRNAGAGAGAFNTNRQIGGVIGSAVVVAALTSRLATTMPAAAQDAARSLPDAVREPFVEGFRQSAAAGLGAAGGGLDLPADVPPDVVDQVRAAAQSAVEAGFAAAAAQTLAVTVAVLLVGAVCAFAMRGGRPGHEVPGPSKQTAPTVGVAGPPAG
ncbi:MDR family MFS transporter [Cellulomonas xiejunii]|uniref:Multidrug efflux MFS transporter n=1 Tax=Cellulomonas xiejunii TaxID=2968083 RepID=A0ABY5KWQ1_9CELL|nr:MDR family MFS transporter [Cellulomonas xiejunii]MCC2322761.1 multidrug efflux MFS transporter [Cellulomonas xiejunii]UUI72788.1 multidrug efflux MFS transporter [Cellulomonas xiejunii]